MFPTGAYAHSFGMEGAVQDGLINDEADFRAFIHDMIIPGLEKLELPTAAAAFAAAQDADLAKLCELDQLYGAMKPSRELREATARTGRQRLSLNLELTAEPFWRDIEQARLAKHGSIGKSERVVVAITKYPAGDIDLRLAKVLQLDKVRLT